MTTETLTLTDFLLARIAEDEAAAENVLADRPPGASPVWDMGAGYFDPDRVLAECEAKRRIVESANEERPTGANWTDYMRGIWAARHAVLYDLALPYADHPDYRDEWRP